MIAVFTPTTSPCAVTSGPPELPGLRAASVWMRLSMSRPPSDAQRPAERADHAGRHRRLEPVGVADGHDQLADAQAARVAEARRHQVGRVHAQDGEVGLRVVADELRVQFASVAQRHAQLVGAVGDVAVGEDEAVAGDDEAGARAGVAGLGRVLRGRRRPRRPGRALRGRACSPSAAGGSRRCSPPTGRRARRPGSRRASTRRAARRLPARAPAARRATPPLAPSRRRLAAHRRRPRPPR